MLHKITVDFVCIKGLFAKIFKGTIYLLKKKIKDSSELFRIQGRSGSLVRDESRPGNDGGSDRLVRWNTCRIGTHPND